MSTVTHQKLNPLDPFENCESAPARELLARGGYTPPSPDKIPGEELGGRLWELIYAMAGIRCFLTQTDHVEDRALYQWLHDEWLEEPMADIPASFGWCADIEVPDDLSGASSLDERDGDEPEDFWDPPPGCERDEWLPKPPGTPSRPPWVDGDPGPERERAARAADPSPDDLPSGDEESGWVTARLWERLHNLACRGIFFEHTDHLTDRQLYRELWRNGFRDGPLPREGRYHNTGWVYDVASDEGPEPSHTWLACYASDAERDGFALKHPGRELPERRSLVAQRDWRLPRPERGTTGS